MQCSIDGLLDRTVKHMLFLESVGDRAIKLRQCIQPEVSDFIYFPLLSIITDLSMDIILCMLYFSFLLKDIMGIEVQKGCIGYQFKIGLV